MDNRIAILAFTTVEGRDRLRALNTKRNCGLSLVGIHVLASSAEGVVMTTATLVFNTWATGFGILTANTGLFTYFLTTIIATCIRN